MTRLQEIDNLIDANLELVSYYSRRAAELMGSVRVLEKERKELTGKTDSPCSIESNTDERSC